MDESVLVCGKINDSDAFINKYDENLNVIFKRTFSGNGTECFDNILNKSNGNILVTGSFYKTTGGGDFEKYNSKFKPLQENMIEGICGSFAVEYNSNGEILNVNFIQAMSHISFFENILPLVDGASLLKYSTLGTIVDPVSKQNFESEFSSPYGSYYVFRTDSNGKFVFAYKIEEKFLLGSFWFQIESDGSYKIGIIEDTKIFKVYHYVDKYNLQMLVNSTVNLDKKQYKESLWDNYVSKLNAALNLLDSDVKDQASINTAASELENSINNLSSVNNEETDKPNVVNTVTPSTQNSQSAINNSSTPSNSNLKTNTPDKESNSVLIITATIVSVAVVGAVVFVFMNKFKRK